MATITSKATAGFAGDPGIGGVAYRWPSVIDALPVTAVADIDGALDLGTVTDAGVTHAISRDTEDRKDIAGRTYYVLQTSVDHSFTVTLADALDLNVLRTIVGDDNVVVDGEGRVTVRHNAKQAPRQSWVFDFLLAGGIKRTVIGEGQLTDVGDVVHTASGMYEFQVTIKVFASAQLDGDFVRDLYAFEGAAVLGVATAMLPEAAVGTEYEYKVTAIGGKAPYTFSAEGELPEGMALSADGVLSGAPTIEGSTDIVVKVTDADGGVARKTLTFVAVGE